MSPKAGAHIIDAVRIPGGFGEVSLDVLPVCGRRNGTAVINERV